MKKQQMEKKFPSHEAAMAYVTEAGWRFVKKRFFQRDYFYEGWEKAYNEQGHYYVTPLQLSLDASGFVRLFKNTSGGRGHLPTKVFPTSGDAYKAAAEANETPAN